MVQTNIKDNSTKQLNRNTGDIMHGGYRHDECFGLKVVDDGFLPLIMPDDVVIVHKQSDVESGELAAVMINGDTNAVLRRIWHDKNGGMILTVDGMIPRKDSRYEPVTIDADELYRVHCFGKVVSLMRDMTSKDVMQAISAQTTIRQACEALEDSKVATNKVDDTVLYSQR